MAALLYILVLADYTSMEEFSMRNFWTVMKFELFLIFRHNWWTRLLALAMLLIGVLAADNNRNQPWGTWGQILVCGMFLSLILTLSTGNQINRDREHKLDGVVLSTPVATLAYVLGKYGAALLSLLSLTDLSLLAAVLTDQFYGIPQRVLFLSPVLYPSLGPQPYIIGWFWLILVPVIFGATFMFASITLTRGKRVIAYTVAVMIWLIPLFATNSFKDLFFDITAASFPEPNIAREFALQHNLYLDVVPTSQLAQKIVHLSLAETPPSYLLNALLWNRLFFLGIAIVLLCVTIFGVRRTRRSA